MSDFPSTEYAESGDLSIAYQVWGDGPTEVVLTPGIVSHLEAKLANPEYVQWLRALSSFSRLIIFDKRGNGMSDRIAGAPTLDERVSDIEAVMDAAGCRAASLVGLSEGAAMSLVYAARRPDRVQKLVLGGGFVAGRIPRGIWTHEKLEEACEGIKRNWGTVGADHHLSRHGPGPEDPEGQELFARVCRMSATPSTMVALLRMSSLMDVRNVLPHVHQPTLLLRREGESVEREHLEYVAAHLSNGRFQELPGHEHLPYRGASADYVRAIRNFILDEPVETKPAMPDRRFLASVLFTDLVGSTERQTKIGDGPFRELMDRHDRLSLRQIERHGGRFIRSTGDGVIAIFDAPTSAIACAVAIRDAVTALDVKIRSGVHTGEIEERGTDISGTSVNVAARVADLAQADEVLVTDVTRQLMIGSTVRFHARGSFELKGLSEAWELSAIAV
jgi:class 3 adenylate cyclase